MIDEPIVIAARDRTSPTVGSPAVKRRARTQGTSQNVPTEQECLERAIQLIAWRAARSAHPNADLFADPAWDMLLALYVADVQEKPLTVSQLFASSKSPSTTALRWMRKLIERGLMTTERDPADARRSFAKQTPAAKASMKDYLASLSQDAPRPEFRVPDTSPICDCG